jgi:hypothetical protein
MLICLILFVSTLPLFSEAHQHDTYSQTEALKVLDLIDKIELSPDDAGLRGKRKVEVSESELNAYIAYRIETEKEEVMKELRLKFFDNNRIEGKLFFDLRGQKLPKLLRPEMTFYFSGRIETLDGAVRLNLEELFLEGQKIQPMVLDLVFFIAARINKVESSSINDWYLLPYGITDIKVFDRLAEFYY